VASKVFHSLFSLFYKNNSDPQLAKKNMYRVIDVQPVQVYLQGDLSLIRQMFIANISTTVKCGEILYKFSKSCSGSKTILVDQRKSPCLSSLRMFHSHKCTFVCKFQFGGRRSDSINKTMEGQDERRPNSVGGILMRFVERAQSLPHISV
jgi:hypothetical protein